MRSARSIFSAPRFLAAAAFACALLNGCAGDLRQPDAAVEADPATPAAEAPADSAPADTARYTVRTNPDIPAAIQAEIDRDWGESGHLSVERVDLNGDGTDEYLLTGFCGSSGACVGYVYRQEEDGSFTRLLEGTTGELGFTVGRQTTRGWRNVESEIPPLDSQDAGSPFVYRWDGERYAPRTRVFDP